MNEKLLDQNTEETTKEEVVIDSGDNSTEEKNEVSIKKIKDYLSKDLFKDIKVISDNENVKESENSDSSLTAEYDDTFKDISENQIISAKVIGISDSDVMVDIGFKSEGLISRSEFDNKDLPEIGSNIDIFLERLKNTFFLLIKISSFPWLKLEMKRLLNWKMEL